MLLAQVNQATTGRSVLATTGKFEHVLLCLFHYFVVIKLEPLLALPVEDKGEVVATVCLSIVNDDAVQEVRNLAKVFVGRLYLIFKYFLGFSKIVYFLLDT